ncbi:MAG: hypothetical protein ACYCSN_13230 [Acidobacteriaceae bacterium]
MNGELGSKRGVRRCLLGAILILFAVGTSACRDQVAPARKLVGGASYPLLAAPHSIGNIDGVDLSIPQNYLLSSVVYAGQDAWTYSAKKETPSYKHAIDNFGILLRLSNLEPIKSQADWQDWLNSLNTTKPFLYETWLTAGISGRYYPPDGTYKKIIPFWLSSSAGFGPFNIKAPSEFGLTHYLIKKKMPESPDEIYFDSGTWKNLITCQTTTSKIREIGTFSSCTDRFLLPEIHVVVDADFSKDDLYRWREIQSRIKEIIDSFIVKPKLN